MDRIISVLVVDDSAFVRKVMKEILQRSPFLEVVGTARDGEEALEMVKTLKPDVVTLDLIMPGKDGLEFLKEQMQREPVAVVICSIASESGEMALKALDAGAIDFVQKPTVLATDRLYEMSEEIIEKVKAAAKVPIARIRSALSRVISEPKPSEIIKGRGLVDAVVIGISTGGPQALRYMMPRFPADFPIPIAIVLHMPVGYTEAYANKLNELSQLNIFEAKEGDIARSATAMIAPAGKHLTLVRRDNTCVVAHIDARPLDKQHRPSVDVLFRSAAETFGSRVLGVVMTGMGRDGKEGSAWIKSQGGMIFTEAEDSCVIYGMPRSVAEAGLSDKVVPLDRMSQAIREVV